MNQKAGAQIGVKAFLQSVLILLVLMLAAGVLTRALPAGSFVRTEHAERAAVVPESFTWHPKPEYPVWRWFTAPLEVLWSPDALVVITIILFILVVGGAFAVLEASGILKDVLGRIVQRFGNRKYVLLLVIAFFFMFVGAFFGLFEEVVPLVPLMIALAYYLGWDALVGLGMSVLATNMGFSAAITNPFTIGVAQKMAGLPIFSGGWLRLPIFIVVYILLAIFLVSYARRIEKNPQHSLIHGEDEAERQKYSQMDLNVLSSAENQTGKAVLWFAVLFVLMIIVLVSSPFVPGLSDLALPLVGLLFLAGGLGAGLLAGMNFREAGKAFWQGIGGIAPGALLILMAASIKHIVSSGGVMDTILFYVSQPLSAASPFFAALLIYFLALIMEFFVASAGAKAVLMMPVLLPLADLVHVTRQTAVTAYCFGDGFSNLAYPTNPVLLIALGLAMVSYGKWLRWTLKLWFWVFLATVFFLWVAVMIGYGPF